MYYNIARREDIDKHEFISGGFKKYRICDAHFKDEDLIQMKKGLRLKPGATPYRLPQIRVSILLQIIIWP